MANRNRPTGRQWLVAGLMLVLVAVVVALTLVLIDVMESGMDGYGVAELPDPYDVPQHPEAINAGAVVYGNRCASCHGVTLQPGEAPPLPPLQGVPDATDVPWHQTDTVLQLLQRLDVRPPMAPLPDRPQGMPLGAMLPEDEVTPLLAFLKARWPEPERQSGANPANP